MVKLFVEAPCSHQDLEPSNGSKEDVLAASNGQFIRALFVLSDLLYFPG
jgi:hypothetical protein